MTLRITDLQRDMLEKVGRLTQGDVKTVSVQTFVDDGMVEAGIARPSISSRLNTLKRKGFLEMVVEGGCTQSSVYVLTDLGRSLLAGKIEAVVERPSGCAINGFCQSCGKKSGSLILYRKKHICGDCLTAGDIKPGIEDFATSRTTHAVAEIVGM